jgi:hypothetical protein
VHLATGCLLALLALRDELEDDLGGGENPSVQERMLVEGLIYTKLQLSSVNVWLFAQKSLVTKKTRGLAAGATRSHYAGEHDAGAHRDIGHEAPGQAGADDRRDHRRDRRKEARYGK